MLQFLLIPLISGIVLHTSGEEQTVSAIAEKHSSTSEISLPLSTSELPTSETVTLTSGDESKNEIEFQKSSTQSTHHSSVTMKNTETANYEKTSNRDSTAESIPSTKHSTRDSLELNSTENSKVSSSDIDYGGYSSASEKNGAEVISTRKHLPASSKNEYVPAESITVVLGIGMTVEGTASSHIDESSPSTITNSSPTSISVTKNPSELSSEDHTRDSVFTTLWSTDGTEGTASVPSSSPQKVSPSPKRATKKRSLNSTNTNSGAFTSMQTSPSLTLSGGTTSPSSKIDSFDTTATNTKPKLDIEELPSPLPLEMQSEVISSLAVTSTGLPSFETSTEEKVDAEKDSSVNQTYTSTVLTPNIVPIVSTEGTESNVSFQDSEISTETVPVREMETLSSTNIPGSMIQTMTSSHISSSEALPHEDDDIIYAGFADEPLGATFDPDGMRNDFPQDPDSIIFSVPPKDDRMSTERYTDSKPSNPEREMSGPLSPEDSYLDLDDLEFPTHKTENSSEVYDNSISNSNLSEPLVKPEVLHYNPALESDDNEPMVQDAPHLESHGDTTESSQSDLKVFTASTTPDEADTVTLSDFKIVKDSPVEETDKPVVDSSSDYMYHHTDQSVIRPVKVISPTAKSASVVTTSDAMLQSTEFYSTSSSDDLGSIDEQNSDVNASSPIVQPNPSQSTVGETIEMSDTSTTSVQSSSKRDVNATQQYEDTNPNSTITGVAVKTSVSVSLPISKILNDSQEISNSNASESAVPIKVISPTSLINKETESTLPETSADTTTNSPSTSAAPFKIRKPGIRVPGMSDSVRTRKPYVPPALKRASSTAGPPVSIFNKPRTRVNSITSSTTSRPFPQFSTIRIHYASHLPGLRPAGEMFVSVEPITTTVPPTTTTEEPISEVPFTDQTYVPSLSSEDDITLVKVGGGIVLKQGLRWTDQLGNRHSPEYKEIANQLHLHLEQLFRSSTIATQLWRIEIDGFNGTKISRPVEVDFVLYLIKSPEMIAVEHLANIFHGKLSPNNTFARYRVDPTKTAFEILQEEPLYKPTPSPEDQYEPPVPQWAIAVIVICAASLIFIVLFAAVTMYGRHHMRRRYGDKLRDDELDRSSGEWESKMTAAYENMAADTIYDAEDLPGDAYKKSCLMD